MPPFSVAFYTNNGKLIRCVTIGNKTFVEQFDPDGWYSYHSHFFETLDEPKALALALSILQTTNPGYKNKGQVRFKLYEFSLLHFSDKPPLLVE